MPDADALESLAYRFAIVGFIFWTFTLIAGSIWANDAWGRFWGFDTKEVWTFVIWVLYAGYIHARATRGWRGTRSAWLSIIGFTAVLFNFTIVNVFFKGLHAYSGLTRKAPPRRLGPVRLPRAFARRAFRVAAGLSRRAGFASGFRVGRAFRVGWAFRVGGAGTPRRA